jgi:hypothetical protein
VWANEEEEGEAAGGAELLLLLPLLSPAALPVSGDGSVTFLPESCLCCLGVTLSRVSDLSVWCGLVEEDTEEGNATWLRAAEE